MLMLVDLKVVKTFRNINAIQSKLIQNNCTCFRSENEEKHSGCYYRVRRNLY